ncbi:ADP-ribosylglycohydrolase family protein [Runella sp.]|uniref:ADP-ribosylglycohydrolase family protein n=1 Tax=Runella sp. TaxID=1960881 RepID=UPI00260B104C|nr:ADP-ribosylglycohydrolase family protein [Runella sp.]
MRIFLLLFSTALLWSCQPQKPNNAVESPISKSSLTRDELYDKVFGMLLGSAIGDAMGAPTEMWLRPTIQLEYGFVDRLDSMVRAPSAEGTWAYNLPAGGTTDDTRWKKLTIEFLLTQANSGDLDAGQFAAHLVKQYENDLKRLKKTEGFDPEPYEMNLMRMAWLQEWARVAKPFAEKNYAAYTDSLSRFYGGEMVCAGLLYAPAVGAFYPENPTEAYRQMYKISLFDIGYARDISGLAAAMTSEAMRKNPSKTTIINVARTIDPQHFFKSRLVGRSAYRILQQARLIVSEANKLQKKDIPLSNFPLPKNLNADTLFMARMYKAFELLDAQTQDMPFHAGEIYLQVITALLFCDFDFEKTMAFLVNLGRDNDTTSAIAGGILGAYWGADHLPEKMKRQVLTVNKEKLGTDLEKLAKDLTEKILKRY